MCNQGIRIRDYLVLEFGDLELASFVAKILKALRKFGEKHFHPSPSIGRESNFRVIKVELFMFHYHHQCAFFFFATETSTNLNRPFFLYVGGKISCVEVGGERAYEENELRRLDLLFNLIRTQLPDVNLRSGS